MSLAAERVARLKGELVRSLETARGIAAKAESQDREFTADERSIVKQAMEKAEAIKSQLALAQGELDGELAVKAFGAKVDLRPTDEKSETWGDQVVEAAKKAAAITGTYGAKAVIAAGSVPVAQPFTDGILNTPRRVNFIQDHLRANGRVKPIEGTDRFSFMRQTVRDFQAAPVAKGGLKPTSTVTTERVEGRAVVIAHTSEPIPEQDLADFSDLRAFIDAEMELGLATQIAHQIINGPGTGENLTGVRNASGIQVHSRGADDLFTAYRKARGKLENQDVDLSGAFWVMHPNDTETLDLVKDNNGRYYFEGPKEGDADRLWRVPVIKSKEVPAGEQLLMDLSAVALVERERPQIAIGGINDDFLRNQVRVRCEGRYGLAIERPFLIVKVTA